MHRRLTVVVAGCLLSTAGCAHRGGAQGPVHSLKGYELYSWPEGNDWAFALLPGTNRLKTLEEIRSPGRVLTGLSAVENALRALAPGEAVFWVGESWLRNSGVAGSSIALPPSEVRDQVAALCAQLQLELTVDEGS